MNDIRIKSKYKLSLAKPGDAGYDVKNMSGSKVIWPFCSATFDTDVKIQMPVGMECKVRGKSGLWFKRGIAIGQEGTVDSGYIGPIKVKLINLSFIPRVIKYEDKIAQLVFSNYIEPVFVDEDFKPTRRGMAGFGSTGRK